MKKCIKWMTTIKEEWWSKLKKNWVQRMKLYQKEMYRYPKKTLIICQTRILLKKKKDILIWMALKIISESCLERNRQKWKYKQIGWQKDIWSLESQAQNLVFSEIRKLLLIPECLKTLIRWSNTGLLLIMIRILCLWFKLRNYMTNMLLRMNSLRKMMK